MCNSAGLVNRKDVKANRDADAIKLMRKAGAILLCITNISELGLWFETNNHVHGRTFNAYDTRRMVGGSSGGEACLISACGSLIGIGSDLSGGVRISACLNGIFAHKPTNGIF
jgi:fatty acid amide hydrolase 2